jgi:hypothetical protein
MTRKEFLALSGSAGVGAALSRVPALAQDVNPAVQKIHKLIESQKEQHIARVQADLRQPSVSSWNMGIQEMADRMVESFRELGCKEAERVETDGFPGVFAYYDAGAPKTVVVYMMYDTQPFEKERWSRDPLGAERGPMGDFADVIIARGAVNSKGPNRFFLNACQAIREVEGKLPVNVLFTCDGEEERAAHFTGARPVSGSPEASQLSSRRRPLTTKRRLGQHVARNEGHPRVRARSFRRALGARSAEDAHSQQPQSDSGQSRLAAGRRSSEPVRPLREPILVDGF